MYKNVCLLLHDLQYQSTVSDLKCNMGTNYLTTCDRFWLAVKHVCKGEMKLVPETVSFPSYETFSAISVHTCFRCIRKKNALVIQLYLSCQINLHVIKKVLLVMQVALHGNNKYWLVFTVNKLSGKAPAKEMKRRHLLL